MSIVNAIQSGQKLYSTTSNSNINISVGDGNSNINVTGGDINIATGNGNQNITANSNGSLAIVTGDFGTDVIKASAFDAFISTNGGDDKVLLDATSFDIDAGEGNNTVAVKGNVNNTTAQNKVTFGNGNDTLIASANNLTVNDGDGNLTAITYGDNLNLTSGNGTHNIGFWGDNININLGDGNTAIQTLDQTIASANSSTIATLEQYGVIDAIEKATSISSIVTERKILSSSNTDVVQSIIDEYSLNTTEAAALRQLYTSGKINETYADGTPKYVLIASPALSTVNGKTTYVIGVRDGQNHTWSYSDYSQGVKAASTSAYTKGNFQNGKECIATSAGWTTENVSGQVGTLYQDVTKTTYLIDGSSSVNITAGKGTKNIALTGSSDGNSNIFMSLGDGNSNVSVTNGYAVVGTETSGVKGEMKNVSTSVYVSGKSYNSPLILDTNKDGKVSAAAGLGVDVDGDGIADGAAVDGDKMLAMSDINGNGTIDGTEVFGNNTVNPFTGEAIKAANGFEALKAVAESAKASTGIECIKDGNVDMAALKQALATVGVKLGLISGANNTELEELTDVSYINVADYKEVEATGDVQNRQLGSYSDADGKTYSIDDVWFASSIKEEDNFFKALQNFSI